MTRRLLIAALPALAVAFGALTFGALPARAADAPTAIVFFAKWSGALDDTAMAVIKDAAGKINASHAKRITIASYADSTGSSQANEYLTELRAQRVIDTLVADGVDEARLHMQANGEQNKVGVVSRRVEIRIPSRN